MPQASRRKSSTPAKLISIDPRTGRPIGTVVGNAPAEIAGIVEAARKVAPEWSALAPAGRARILSDVRHEIYRHLDEIVETVALECGKPRVEALGTDLAPALIMMLYFERMSARALRSERMGGPLARLSGLDTKVEWRPFGVVGAITPWNYPFSLSFAAIAPALFAGNTVVVKPSEVTPQVGELIRKVLEPLAPGVATVIQGAGDVGAALVDAPCDKICFIGSPATGRKVAAAAAKQLTPVVMELGGKDAAIVCDDADLDVASSGVLWGSFVNAGQTCASIERIYVVEDIAEEFKAALLDKLEALRHGTDDADVGAVTFKHQLDLVRSQVDDAIEKGAALLAGGPDAASTSRDGSQWYAPTVLEGVTDEMSIMSQETFGPVVAITSVRDEDEAIRRANQEGFNLTASVWTKDKRRAEYIASKLTAGVVTANAHAESYGAPWAPWGGVGESGYGRINGRAGLREFAYPVAIARNSMLKMKRLWWYPYDEETEKSLRSVAAILGAPTLKEKAGAVPVLVRSAVGALKRKL